MLLRQIIRFYLLFSVILISIIAGLNCSHVSEDVHDAELQLRVDNSNMQRNQMWVELIARDIERQRADTGLWPESIKDAGILLSNARNDMWGHPLLLVPYDQNAGLGTVVSYGKDGTVGGEGPNADVEAIFEDKSESPYRRYDGENADCLLHDQLLQKDEISIGYGLLAFPPGYYEAKNASFYNANTFIAGGCILGERRRINALYCNQCRTNRNSWMQDHEEF